MIDITTFGILMSSQADTVAEAWFVNNVPKSNLSWSYDTGEGVLNSSLVELDNSEMIGVIIGTNYTNTSVYITNFTANSSTYSDSKREVVVV